MPDFVVTSKAGGAAPELLPASPGPQRDLLAAASQQALVMPQPSKSRIPWSFLEFASHSSMLRRWIEAIGPVRFRMPDNARPFGSLERFRAQARATTRRHSAELDSCPFVFLSGIGGTAFDWKNIAFRINREFKAYTRVLSLVGHTGELADLKLCTARGMIDQVISEARHAQALIGRRPIIVAHSTGAAAVLAAIRETSKALGEPLAAGVILMAPPLRLKSLRERVALPLTAGDYRRNPTAPIWDSLVARVPESHLMKGDPKRLRAPNMRWMPVSAFIGLNELMPEARAGLIELDIPFLLIQGMEDHLVDARFVIRQYGKNKSGKGQLLRIEQGPHSCMYGSTREDVIHVAYEWLLNHWDGFLET